MRLWPGIVLLMVLGACSTAPKPEGKVAAPPSFGPIAATTEAPDPSPLDQYNIPSGQCGMILWTRSGADVVPVFRSIGTTTASMRIEGETVPLVLLSQEGELRLGMRANQLFSAPGDRTVEARLQWGQGFPGGFYVENGALTLNGADGWSRILPVAGIAGCKR